MKKFILFTFVLTLACGFLVTHGVQPASAAEKGKYGGILKFNHSKPAGIIGNPMMIRGWNNEYAAIPLENLIQADPVNLGQLAPRLATSWELAPDRSNYTLKLRKGVKFHDDTPFNAQAVKWNLDKWVNSSSAVLKEVQSVEVIDDYTIRLNLSAWNNVTIYQLAMDVWIVSPTAFEKNGEKWANYHPVGTGPFKMVEFKRNVSIKFEKFKDYYEEGLPYLDGIHILHIADPMTASASLKKGEVDGWMNVEQVTASNLAKEGKLEVSTGFGPYYLINFNSVDPESPWSKLKMREALEYAIDREAVARVTGRGFRFPVSNVLYGVDNEKAGTTPRKYNPEKAMQLMSEAGYPNGLNIKLFHMAGQEKDAATIFQGSLAEVGIKVQLEALAGAAWHGKLFEPIKGSELVWGFLPGSLINPIQSAYQFMSEKSPLFQTVKRPVGFYEALNQAVSREDLNSGLGDIYQAEKLAYEFAMLSPVLVTKFVALNAPYVKDAYWFYASAPRPNLKHAWLDR